MNIDSGLVVKILKGGMIALIQIPKDFRPTEDEIRAAMAKSGVIYGRLEEQIYQIAANPRTGVFEVARGKPAEAGRDASILYCFRTGPPKLVPRIHADGRADYFDLGIAENVLPGQLLARKTPVVPGVVGTRVDGYELKPKVGRNIHLKAGKGVELSEDGLEAYAEIAGQPMLGGNLVSVSQTFTVTGDLDVSQGSVNFAGNVRIFGDVKRQLAIRAEGNVTVMGNLDGAVIEAGGWVAIAGGVLAKSRITAGADINIGFVENSCLNTTGSLRVLRDLLFTDVAVGAHVRVGGTLCGGECLANLSVTAGNIGSRFGTPTYLEVCSRPKWRALLREDEERLSVVEGELIAIKAALAAPTQSRPQMLQLLHQANRFRTEADELQVEIDHARAVLEGRFMPSVLASEKMYPGVRLAIRDSVQVVGDINENLYPVKILEKNGSFNYRRESSQEKTQRGDDIFAPFEDAPLTIPEDDPVSDANADQALSAREQERLNAERDKQLADALDRIRELEGNTESQGGKQP